LYKWAKGYVKKYEGYSYDFQKNGEMRLIHTLKQFSLKTVFDVGANVGDWTKMALQAFPESTVHAFELSEGTFQTLAANVASHRAVLNNAGLSNMAGEIEFKDYGDNAGGNTMLHQSVIHDDRIKPSLRSARVITGDLYCQEHGIDKIDFLKIDVEGAENLVLAGLTGMLERQAIDFIQFEYNYSSGDAHFLMKDFYEFFGQFGYAIGPLKPKGVMFCDFHYKLNDFTSGPNYIAVPKGRADFIHAVSQH
jgi:FkbM family methyltransferase